ncbi:MAG: hypothetical protein JOZ81_05840 [Chloroflexi bacterium]|nr:hypothetical protein [Chloroflexota bacterium]
MPGERVLEAQDVTLTMWSVVDPSQIEVLTVKYPPTTFEDTYAHTRQLARDWQVNPASLEESRQHILDNPQQGKADSLLQTFPTAGGERLSVDGPAPYIRIPDSFKDDGPFIVDFELDWLPGPQPSR